MWKRFCVVLGVAGIASLAACAAPSTERDYRAFPDDYRFNPDDHSAYSRSEGGVADRDGRYDRYNDRDGDGVLNWRDRFPDDPRRF